MNAISSFVPTNQIPSDPFCQGLSYAAQGLETTGMFASTLGFYKIGIPTWITGKALNVAESSLCRQNPLETILLEQKFSLITDLAQWAIVGASYMTSKLFERSMQEHQDEIYRLIQPLNVEVNTIQAKLPEMEKGLLAKGQRLTLNQIRRSNQLIQQKTEELNNAKSRFEELQQQIKELKASSPPMQRVKDFCLKAFSSAQVLLGYKSLKEQQTIQKNHYENISLRSLELAVGLGYSIHNSTAVESTLQSIDQYIADRIRPLFNALDRFLETFSSQILHAPQHQLLNMTYLRQTFLDLANIHHGHTLVSLSYYTGVDHPSLQQIDKSRLFQDVFLHPSNRLVPLITLKQALKEKHSPSPSTVLFNGFPVHQAGQNFLKSLENMEAYLHAFLSRFVKWTQKAPTLDNIDVAPVIEDAARDFEILRNVIEQVKASHQTLLSV